MFNALSDGIQAVAKFGVGIAKEIEKAQKRCSIRILFYNVATITTVALAALAILESSLAFAVCAGIGFFLLLQQNAVIKTEVDQLKLFLGKALQGGDSFLGIFKRPISLISSAALSD